jgi:hypothetical protein
MPEEPSDSESKSLSPQEEELLLLSSVEYALEILPRCDIPPDRSASTEVLLKKALNLLKLKHEFIQANMMYNNMDDNLVEWCSTSEIEPTGSPELPANVTGEVSPPATEASVLLVYHFSTCRANWRTSVSMEYCAFEKKT